MLFVYAAVCAVMSLLAFVFFAIDKARAKKNGPRFPELTLLTFAALGGGVGAMLAMQTLRHKTDFRRKPHFGICVPVCAVLQIVFAVLLAFFVG